MQKIRVELHGSIYDNGSNGYFRPTNCAFLKGSATSATGNAYTPSSDSYKISALSAEEMPDVLTIINKNYFVEDTEGINNGYPLLAWQVDTSN